MITSPQGLCEVPHVEAPASAKDLAAAARKVHLPAVTELPMLFLPGVRSGAEASDRDRIMDADIMRGEEVIGLGLRALGRLPAGGIFLNLGSHWKAIRVDAAGRIASSTSTLSGELIQA